jgi:hypothetical protein
VIAGADPIGAAELAIAERRDTSACGSCGNPEPARLGDGGCEACVAFPRCWLCGRWTDLFPSTRIALADGSVADLCDICREKGS